MHDNSKYKRSGSKEKGRQQQITFDRIYALTISIGCFNCEPPLTKERVYIK